MDPLAAMFGAQGLSQVDMPALLYRPQSDGYLKSEGNALLLAGTLPRPPQQITVPGSHFVFIDPCPAAIAAEAVDICKDAPGIDRVAIHLKIQEEISNFLQGNL
jgi:predicted dienelactone hydrolase